MHVISELEAFSLIARGSYGDRGAVLVTVNEDGSVESEPADMDPGQTGTEDSE